MKFPHWNTDTQLLPELHRHGMHYSLLALVPAPRGGPLVSHRDPMVLSLVYIKKLAREGVGSGGGVMGCSRGAWGGAEDGSGDGS